MLPRITFINDIGFRNKKSINAMVSSYSRNMNHVFLTKVIYDL